MNADQRNDSRRRLILPSGPSPRRHGAALLSRLLPMVVLAVGATWWMIAMQPAAAQFPQAQDFNRSGFNQTRTAQNPSFQPSPYSQGGTQTAIPSIPSAAMGGEQVVAPEDAEAEGEAWKMPAFIEKLSQGGWLMIPLAFCSLVVFALSIERMIASGGHE